MLNLYAVLRTWAITQRNITVETDHLVISIMTHGFLEALVTMQILIQ